MNLPRQNLKLFRKAKKNPKARIVCSSSVIQCVLFVALTGTGCREDQEHEQF